MCYQKLFQKCCMEIHVKIDICTFYLYKIHVGLKKNVYSIISVFMKKMSLKEQNKEKITQDTLFSKQYQRILEQLI